MKQIINLSGSGWVGNTFSVLTFSFVTGSLLTLPGVFFFFWSIVQWTSASFSTYLTTHCFESFNHQGIQQSLNLIRSTTTLFHQLFLLQLARDITDDTDEFSPDWQRTGLCSTIVLALD